ncbi:hypothetical protein [Lapillicoccus jejuensis]|uniref:ABC-2 type transport system permease protein n=1 Tax=Lapillicoccus jejuensis TaxID=402171 RepID=A0A542DY54_9MICO|nr:hypothetical protein [Lapillicoccus jejuensis]TQJ07976.1 hypothetical protein FB458_1051 [Lapillicoccus jejuensis]
MSGEDRARLADARRVVTGDRQGEGNAVYAVYVAVIAAGAYGVPASQQLFRFLDARWLAEHLGGVRGPVVGVVALVALLALAFRAGAVRGPAVPDLPYLDHVATSPLDRAVVLRRWWRLALVGCLTGGLLAGLVAGAGLAIAAVTGPLVLLPAVAVGGVAALLVAWAWLEGQVRGRDNRGHGRPGSGTLARPARSLRSLPLASLRAQAARSAGVGGGVLAGDLRAVRLEVAAPTTRARGRRLRAAGPRGTMVRRDVLGLRRSPGALVTGVALTGVGAFAVVHAATPGVPSVVALAGTVLAYLGVGQWAEGLRLQGDNSGTVPLVGLDPSTEALTHLVVPGAAYGLVTLVVGGATVALGGASALGLPWALVLGAAVLGAQLMAAFRPLPGGDASLISPGGRLGTMLLAYAVPLIAAAVVGTGATAMLGSASLRGQAPVALLIGSALVVAWGRHRVRALTDAHRD